MKTKKDFTRYYLYYKDSYDDLITVIAGNTKLSSSTYEMYEVVEDFDYPSWLEYENSGYWYEGSLYEDMKMYEFQYTYLLKSDGYKLVDGIYPYPVGQPFKANENWGVYFEVEDWEGFYDYQVRREEYFRTEKEKRLRKLQEKKESMMKKYGVEDRDKFNIMYSVAEDIACLHNESVEQAFERAYFFK